MTWPQSIDEENYRRYAFITAAAEVPPKRIIVLGMWLLFGPVMIISTCVLMDGSMGVFMKAWLAVTGSGSIVILYRTTKNYFVKSRANRSEAETAR